MKSLGTAILNLLLLTGHAVADDISDVLQDLSIPEHKKLERLKELIPEPSKAEIQKLKYPPKPNRAVFEKIIKKSLKDPESAKFSDISEPVKSWISNGKTVPIYVVCGMVNAKNSFGGYSGFTPFAVIVSPTFQKAQEIKDGEILNGYIRYQSSNPCLK